MILDGPTASGRRGDRESARRGAGTECEVRTASGGSRCEDPVEHVAGQGGDRECRDHATVGRGQGGKRGTLEAELHVRAGHSRRVAVRPEVLERVQPGTGLRHEQRQQGEQDDRFLAVAEQDSNLAGNVTRSAGRTMPGPARPFAILRRLESLL